MPPPAPPQPNTEALHERVLDWYADHARDLPWRRPDCSPWGVFVSEVMAQQTPLSRVEPAWVSWMDRWPTPAGLAADSPGEAVRAWGRLGYPRRALRRHEAATVMVQRFDGEVPHLEDDLLTLPGVGAYTAAAVAAFAFGSRAVVLDTNVRRVQARVITGREYPAPSLTRVEQAVAADLLPDGDDEAATWNVAVMELGALICTARSPKCEPCPVLDLCRWVADGRPAHSGPPRRGQAWVGTDRQVRGEILQRLRDSPGPVAASALRNCGPDSAQVERALAALIQDGLVEPAGGETFALPA